MLRKHAEPPSPAIFLATLGQRPEAITIAMDILRERYHYSTVGIIHTDPLQSGITTALRQLTTVLAADYPDLLVQCHEIVCRHNLSLLDIVDSATAEDYHQGMIHILRAYRQMGVCLHLLVAGGRKAMSIYATLAAALVFGAEDRVWIVLSPGELLAQPGQFHCPPALRAQVTVVELPIVRVQRPDDRGNVAIIDAPTGTLIARERLRARLLALLSRKERAIIAVMEGQPHLGNEQIAVLLGRTRSTIENQFRSIYAKLLTYLQQEYAELGYDGTQNKRQMLLDIIQRHL